MKSCGLGHRRRGKGRKKDTPEGSVYFCPASALSHIRDVFVRMGSELKTHKKNVYTIKTFFVQKNKMLVDSINNGKWNHDRFLGYDDQQLHGVGSGHGPERISGLYA